MDTAASRSYTSEQRGSREEIPKTVASPTYPSLAWRWLNLKLFIKLMSQVHNLAWVPSTVMGGKLPIYLEVTASVEFERVIFFQSLLITNSFFSLTSLPLLMGVLKRPLAFWRPSSGENELGITLELFSWNILLWLIVLLGVVIIWVLQLWEWLPEIFLLSPCQFTCFWNKKGAGPEAVSHRNVPKILRTGSKKERRNNRFKRSNKFKIFQSIFGKIFQILYLVSEKKNVIFSHIWQQS